MADSFQSSKVAGNEQSSSTKFDNFVQAVEDAINSLDNSNVSAAAAILVSKLAAGSNGDFLKTTAGVPTWAPLAYSTYVPVWTSDGTPVALGNAVIAGRYIQIGKFVAGSIVLFMGSTTTYGTGNYYITLPVAANAGLSSEYPVAHLSLVDASSGNRYMGHIRLSTASVCGMEVSTSPASLVGATVPFTWAVGDTLMINFSYESV
jgi:hypothetical protein